MQEDISQRLASAFPGADIEVQLDGNRALLSVTSAVFADMTRVRRQQAVYACIEDLIATGELHAVTIKAQAPA